MTENIHSIIIQPDLTEDAQVAGFKSEHRPASVRNKWPASFWNAWPTSSEFPTNDANDRFEFSIKEITENLEKGKSINRTMFAIEVLLDAGLIGDKGTTEVEEPFFAEIVEDNERRFYITKLGLDEFDEKVEADSQIRRFLTTEVSLHMRLLAFIYANTRSSLDFFCRLSTEKLSMDKLAVISALSQHWLIKTFFFKDSWIVTEEGRMFLATEAKTKSISLENYISRIGEMSLDEVFDAKKGVG